MVFIWEKLGALPNSPLLRAIFRACTLFVTISSISTIEHANEFKHKVFTVTPKFVSVFVEAVFNMHNQENARLISKKWRIYDFKLERSDSNRIGLPQFDQILPYKIIPRGFRTSHTMTISMTFDSMTMTSQPSNQQGGVDVADGVDESGSVTIIPDSPPEVQLSPYHIVKPKPNFVFSNCGLPLACMFNTPRLNLALGVDTVSIKSMYMHSHQKLQVSVKAVDSSILGQFTVEPSRLLVEGFFMLGGVKYHYDSRWDKSILRPLYALLPENNFILLRKDDEESATRVLVVLPGAPVWKISEDKLEIETGEVFEIPKTRKPLIQNMMHFGILEVSGKLLGLPGAFVDIELSQNNENELFYPKIVVKFANAHRGVHTEVLGEVVVQTGIEVTSALEVGVRLLSHSGNDHFKKLAATSFAQLLQHTVPRDYVFLRHAPNKYSDLLKRHSQGTRFHFNDIVLLFTKPLPGDQLLYDSYSLINYTHQIHDVSDEVTKAMSFSPDMCLYNGVYEQARLQSSIAASQIVTFGSSSPYPYHDRLRKMKAFLEKYNLMPESNQFYYMRYKTLQFGYLFESGKIRLTIETGPKLKWEHKFTDKKEIETFFKNEIGIAYIEGQRELTYVSIRNLQWNP